MAGCREWDQAASQWQKAYRRYRDESFRRHSTGAFKSMQFCFTTAAPINWNEIQVDIHLAPEFTGLQANPYLATWFNMVSFYITKTWTEDEVIIRSPRDSVNHIIELPAPKERFNGDALIAILEGFPTQNVPMTRLGSASISERNIHTWTKDGQTLSRRGRDDVIYTTGPLTRVMGLNDASSLLSSEPPSYTEQ